MTCTHRQTDRQTDILIYRDAPYIVRGVWKYIATHVLRKFIEKSKLPQNCVTFLKYLFRFRFRTQMWMNIVSYLGHGLERVWNIKVCTSVNTVDTLKNVLSAISLRIVVHFWFINKLVCLSVCVMSHSLYSQYTSRKPYLYKTQPQNDNFLFFSGEF